FASSRTMSCATCGETDCVGQYDLLADWATRPTSTPKRLPLDPRRGHGDSMPRKRKSMTTDWWPAPLAHVPNEDPWAHDHVIVAEIKSFDDGGHMGTRITISALVPIADLDAVCQNLAALEP